MLEAYISATNITMISKKPMLLSKLDWRHKKYGRDRRQTCHNKCGTHGLIEAVLVPNGQLCRKCGKPNHYAKMWYDTSKSEARSPKTRLFENLVRKSPLTSKII